MLALFECEDCSRGEGKAMSRRRFGDTRSAPQEVIVSVDDGDIAFAAVNLMKRRKLVYPGIPVRASASVPAGTALVRDGLGRPVVPFGIMEWYAQESAGSR